MTYKLALHAPMGSTSCLVRMAAAHVKMLLITAKTVLLLFLTLHVLHVAQTRKASNMLSSTEQLAQHVGKIPS